MMEKDTLIPTLQHETLIDNEYYFKYIFKKTEKIVCAVFYIVSNLRNGGTEGVVLDDLENAALQTLGMAGETLALGQEAAEQAVRSLALKLVVLESKLRVAASAQMLSSAQLDVFAAEIDSAVRSIRNLDQEQKQSDGVRLRTPRASRQAEEPMRGGPAPAVQTPDVRLSRRSRILAVLRAQPGAAIKDITDTVKDVSEKTIQRDLNDMIKDNLVIREGEKRWAKYRLNN